MEFFFRRQFCRECFPPERDGGVWEVQRSGSQAEERAGRNRVYFCYYLLFIPEATLCKITLFRFRVLSEDKPSLSFWRSSNPKDKTNWDLVKHQRNPLCFGVGNSSSLSWNDCILCFDALWMQHSSLTVLNELSWFDFRFCFVFSFLLWKKIWEQDQTVRMWRQTR